MNYSKRFKYQKEFEEAMLIKNPALQFPKGGQDMDYLDTDMMLMHRGFSLCKVCIMKNDLDELDAKAKRLDLLIETAEAIIQARKKWTPQRTSSPEKERALWVASAAKLDTWKYVLRLAKGETDE